MKPLKISVALVGFAGLIWTNYAFFRVPFWPPKVGLMVGSTVAGPIAKQVDPTIPVINGPGYDSQFFWLIAQDPLIRNYKIITYLDSPAYRMQRILLPLVAFLLPGSETQLPLKLFLLNCLGWIGCCFLIFYLCRWMNISFLLPTGFIFLNGGLFFAILHPLSDVWATTMSIGGIYFWQRKQYIKTGMLFALATLARETSAIVPLAYFLSNIMEHRRIFSLPALTLAISQVPAIAWTIFLYIRLNQWSFLGGSGNFSLPILGIFQTFERLAQGTGTRSALITGILLQVGALFALLARNHFHALLRPALISQALLILFAGPAILEQNASSARLAIFFLILLSLGVSSRQYTPRTDSKSPDFTDPAR